MSGQDGKRMATRQLTGLAGSGDTTVFGLNDAAGFLVPGACMFAKKKPGIYATRRESERNRSG
jgi:hypothetical protein